LSPQDDAATQDTTGLKNDVGDAHALNGHALGLHRAADLIEDHRIVDGRGHGRLIAVGDLLDRAAQDFSRTGLGQTADHDGEADRSHRPDLLAHQRHTLLLDLGGRTVDAAFEHDETAGYLALEFVLDAEHRAFGNVLVPGQHLLHAAGRKPVAGDIDDVVGAA